MSQADPNDVIFRAIDLAERNRMLELANQVLADEVEANRARLATIEGLGEELRRIQDLDLLAERVLEEMARAARAESAVLLLRDGEQLTVERARRLAGDEDAATWHRSFTMAASSAVGEAVRTGVVSQGRSDAAPIAIEPSLREALGIQSGVVLAIPLASPDVAGGEVRAVIVLADSSDRAGFLEEEVSVLRHIANVATLAFERARLIRTMILRMVAMTEIRDPHETGRHVRRVAGYSVALFDAWCASGDSAAIECLCDRPELGDRPELRDRPQLRDRPELRDRPQLRDRLYIAALLHDVGKVGVPDAILCKPAKLTAEERAVMERHTTIGANLFRGLRTDFDDAARDVALYHHLHWDGGGYPQSAADAGNGTLRAHAIPLFARVVAIADVFDALRSARVYKPAWEEAEVVALMEREAGRQFDPSLVACLPAALPDIRRIGRRFAELAPEGAAPRSASADEAPAA
jgi:response regulator RpfG family c-di-GMP phosphodiesterase